MSSASAAAASVKGKLPRKLKGSFSVYLLTPVNKPHHLQKTYIGFSTNPFHRRRQHNGEIKGGAWRTRRFRPWEIVCVLTGFADNISALKFEWLWQNPYKSKLCREVLAENVKGKRGVGHMGSVRRKLIELYWVLSTHFKTEKGLSLHYVSSEIFESFKNDKLFVSLPTSINLLVGETPDVLNSLYMKDIVVNGNPITELTDLEKSDLMDENAEDQDDEEEGVDRVDDDEEESELADETSRGSENSTQEEESTSIDFSLDDSIQVVYDSAKFDTRKVAPKSDIEVLYDTGGKPETIDLVSPEPSLLEETEIVDLCNLDDESDETQCLKLNCSDDDILTFDFRKRGRVRSLHG